MAERLFPEYEYPIHGVARSKGTLDSAGVFYLEGACHFAVPRTAAAEELLERGALLIATVRFDAGSDPAPHEVRPLPLHDLVRRLAAAPAPN